MIRVWLALILPVRIPPSVVLVRRCETARLLRSQRAARRRVREAGLYLLDKPVAKVAHE